MEWLNKADDMPVILGQPSRVSERPIVFYTSHLQQSTIAVFSPIEVLLHGESNTS